MAEPLTPDVMAMVAAREFFDGAIVNLGLGLPLVCSNFVPSDREVLFHSEQGLLGFGPLVQDAALVEPLLLNAGGQPVTRLPGLSFMSHEESFALVRGGHLDITVLGALEVDVAGNLANAHVPGKPAPGLGGGQDLATCAKRTIILMYHNTSEGRPKLVEECSTVITARACVDRIITDIAVVDVDDDGFVLRSYAPGWSVDEIQQRSGAPLRVADDLTEITLA